MVGKKNAVAISEQVRGAASKSSSIFAAVTGVAAERPNALAMKLSRLEVRVLRKRIREC